MEHNAVLNRVSGHSCNNLQAPQIVSCFVFRYLFGPRDNPVQYNPIHDGNDICLASSPDLRGGGVGGGIRVFLARAATYTDDVSLVNNRSIDCSRQFNYHGNISRQPQSSHRGNEIVGRGSIGSHLSSQDVLHIIGQDGDPVFEIRRNYLRRAYFYDSTDSELHSKLAIYII